MTQPKPNFKRGDVVLVLFDLTTAKTRPAIIVQADNLQTGLPQIIVAMITSQMFRAGLAALPFYGIRQKVNSQDYSLIL